MPLSFDQIESFTRYAAGESSADEAHAIERLLADSPEFQRVVDELRRTMTEGRQALTDGSIDADAALAQVRSRAAAHARPSSPQLFQMPVQRGRWRVAAAAAALALVVGGGWFLTSTGGRSLRSPAATAAFVEYATSRGESRRLTLPDGTQALLAPESRLRVADFSEEQRRVELEGEAYFEVARDVARPFRVRAGGAVVTVLGTEFGVKAYPGDTATAVVVRGGKVAVATASDTAGVRTVLTQGMRARVVGQDIQVTEVDPVASLAWTRGELVFVNEPLSAVVASIERWYDVQIDVAPALRNRRVEVSLSHMSIERALGTLAVALHARVTRVGRQYHLDVTAP